MDFEAVGDIIVSGKSLVCGITDFFLSRFVSCWDPLSSDIGRVGSLLAFFFQTPDVIISCLGLILFVPFHHQRLGNPCIKLLNLPLQFGLDILQRCIADVVLATSLLPSRSRPLPETAASRNLGFDIIILAEDVWSAACPHRIEVRWYMQ